MEFETTIGLEVHTELKTKTKLFCSCKTDFGALPNTQVCEVCMGMPGALPVLNKKVVEFAVMLGIAVNCNILKNICFDRKNYFYPDLPKGYQTSQLYYPICQNGFIDIENDGKIKKIRIKEIHIEEDAGKLIHSDEDFSYIDYNRAGVPLLEIVTMPDFSDEDEVIIFLTKLKGILKALDVSDCKMEQGSLRVDVNLSVKRKEEKALGTRTEMKNINSFKAIKRAVLSESKRQEEIINKGGIILLETRKWDDIKCESLSMRKKETAKDYRYFPDADLPEFFIDDDFIYSIKKNIPRLPDEIKQDFISQYGFSKKEVDILTESNTLINLFRDVNEICNNPKEVLNTILGEILRLLGENYIDADDLKISPTKLALIINMTTEGKINRKTAKTLIEELFNKNIDPEKYVYENNLFMITNEDNIKDIVRKIFDNNKNLILDYKSGNLKIKKFFVGEAMKELKGRAEPKLLNKVIDEMFSEV